MDNLTRAFYATGAFALLSFVAMLVVMLTVSAPGFRPAEGDAQADRAGSTAVMVGDFHAGLREG